MLLRREGIEDGFLEEVTLRTDIIWVDKDVGEQRAGSEGGEPRQRVRGVMVCTCQALAEVFTEYHVLARVGCALRAHSMQFD